MSARIYDVAVIGAGTAGAAVAAFAAERGLATICLDRRPLDQAGASWVNGVSRGAFTGAGLPLPEGDELRGQGGTFHLVAGWGPTRVSAQPREHLEVDMRLLVARLQQRARAAGAELLGDTHVRAVCDDRGEPYRPLAAAGDQAGDSSALVVTTDAGEVRARTLVDASGLAGARLLEQAPVPAEHLCAAAQENLRVVDEQAARAYFHAHGVALGDTLCFTGMAGGYSIVNVRSDGDHVSILTGSIPALGVPSGKQLLDRFVVEQPWIGERLFGGARAIPLRRPRDVIGWGRVALIGDAACQVFSAHGSGIGPGLLAARMLADSLASGAGPYDYAVRWQRRHGGLMAASDLFRRLSQRFDPRDLEQMIARGLMDRAAVEAGLAQQIPALPLAAIPSKLVGLARMPRTTARLARTVARMAWARRLYAAYPARPSDVPAWSRKVALLFGDPPDGAAR